MVSTRRVLQFEVEKGVQRHSVSQRLNRAVVRQPGFRAGIQTRRHFADGKPLLAGTQLIVRALPC